MITRAIRKSLRAEEGQALVLAAVMMLVVAIAVVTTVNIGHNIHERIRMQNNSDAAAYSTAAMEARAFNFYAFSNRTQVSHYVTTMVWQSFLSFLYWVQAWTTDFYAMLRTLSPCSNGSEVIQQLCQLITAPIPGLGALLRIVDRIIDTFKRVVNSVIATPFKRMDGMNMRNRTSPDYIIGRVLIPTFQTLNQALGGIQRGVMMALLARLIPGGKDILEANDKNLPGGAKLLNAAVGGSLSACMYDRAHFDEANGAPFNPTGGPPLFGDAGLDVNARNGDNERNLTRKRTAHAKAAMATVSNATRHGCDQASGRLCIGNFVTDRRLSSLLEGLFNLPSFLSPVTGLLDTIAPKRGQTRLLSFRLGKGDNYIPQGRGNPENRTNNNIRNNRSSPSAPIGMTALGDVLGADDQYRFGIGPDDLGPIQNPFSCGDNDYDDEDEDDGEQPKNCWGSPDNGDEHANKNLKVSIWAMRPGDFATGGIHYRLKYNGNDIGVDSNIGVNKKKKILGTKLGPVCTVANACVKYQVYYANIQRIDDGNHPWKGMTPFSHFEPGHYEADCAQGLVSRNSGPAADRAALYDRDFNQPSTFSVIYKGNADLKNPTSDPNATYNTPALITADGELNLNLFGQNNQLSLDNNRKEFFGLGMMTFSRAQVYYHRPGNWAEHPNFFNPYWKPRLASIYQGIRNFPYGQQFIDNLPGPLSGIPQKIITH